MNKFIGVPFTDDEPSFNGANCYGLVALFYKVQFNIEIPKLDIKNDQSNRVFATFLKEISEHWRKIEDLEFGDVIAMAHDAKHPKIVQHFGVYIGEGRVLHTLNIVNSHVAKLDSLASIIKGYYRWQH